MEKYSHKFSMDGFDLMKQIKNNKESLKLIISGMTGVATFYATLLPSPLNTAFACFIAFVSKSALDTVDFYATKVKL